MLINVKYSKFMAYINSQSIAKLLLYFKDLEGDLEEKSFKYPDLNVNITYYYDVC